MNKTLTLLLVPAVLTLITGCLQPGTTPATTFYQLRPMDPPHAPIGTYTESLVVGPIELGAYLNNPRLVTRPTANQVAYLEHHRWAESLDLNLAFVLAQDIAHLLQSSRTYAYSPRIGVQTDVETLRIRVNAFEVDEKGQAVLDLSFILIEGVERKPIERLILKGPVQDTTPAAQVEAMNKLVGEASLALARIVLADEKAEKAEAP